MNKDTQEALKRLEQELLAQEKPTHVSDDDLDVLIQEFLEEEDTEIPDLPQGYQNFANGYQAYNTDRADTPLDGYSDEIYEEKAAPMPLGLLISAGISLLGSAAAVIYMVVYIL